MAIARQVETERKFDVDASTVLPPLAGVGGVATVGAPLEQQLEALYFDTAELDLARHSITLRRRTGGADAGWHLKLPAGRDSRQEVHHPLGRAVRTVPAPLLEPVRALVRDRPLVPVVRLSTRRRQYDLAADDGTILAEVCDDEVHAVRLHGTELVQDWREWEVELVHGTRDLLGAVGKRLLAAGASRSSATSKLARALAGDVPAPAHGSSRNALARGSAAEMVMAHLSEQTSRLHRHDAGVRADRAGSVHKLRIATRRLRSSLATYRSLFGAARVGPLREELRWLSGALGEARDAQVLRERLDLLIDSEPTEPAAGPARDRIDDDLRDAYRIGREQALEALDSDRYFRLLDGLDDLLRSGPSTAAARAPARRVVPELLRRDARRLGRAVRTADRAEVGHERDVALHEARKKAKRLRYAAETAVPVLGKEAKALASSAKKVQETLGLHQDAVVAREKLRTYGEQAHRSGEDGFTFGRLHALEEWRADQAAREFKRAWKRLHRKRLRRWVPGA